MQSFLHSCRPFQEDTPTLLSLCVSGKTNDEWCQYLETKLSSMQNISHLKTKNLLRERLGRYLRSQEQKDPSLVCHFVVFLGEGPALVHDLSDREIRCIREYNLHNPYYKNDTHFHATFFQNFFCNDKFWILARPEKKQVQIHYYNPAKEKKKVVPLSSDLTGLLESLRDDESHSIQDIYLVENGSVSNTSRKIKTLPSFLTRNEFFDFINHQEMLDRHGLLQQRLERLLINPDLYVFGRLKHEIREAIESYQLKELFIDEKKWERLQQWCDASFFNFKIYPIRVVEPGDVGDRFLQDYNGVLGIKYF